VLDLLRDTWQSLRAHPLRFGLTSLGIVWGSLLLTYLSATMEGVDAHYEREMNEAGPRLVVVTPGSTFKRRVGERGARPVELEPKDVRRVANLHSVEGAAPDLTLWSLLVRAGRHTKVLNTIGLGPESQAIRNLALQEGRFLSPLDLARRSRVAVLGPVAKERLFGREPALGRAIQIESLSFRVIGITRAKRDQLIGINGWDDWAVFIPYTTAQRWFVRSDVVDKFSFAPTTREGSEDAIRHTRQVLAPHHHFAPESDTALSFFNVQDLLRIVRTVLTGLRVFQISAGLLTLLVGAVGVMNIMLVVVAERRSEIGLRKAVGAPGRAIFVQFLAEAVALCLLSGLLGSGLGSALTQFVASTLPPDTPVSSPPVLNPFLVVLITGSLVGVGVVAGVVPALRASRVEPSEALRAP